MCDVSENMKEFRTLHRHYQTRLEKGLALLRSRTLPEEKRPACGRLAFEMTLVDLHLTKVGRVLCRLDEMAVYAKRDPSLPRRFLWFVEEQEPECLGSLSARAIDRNEAFLRQYRKEHPEVEAIEKEMDSLYELEPAEFAAKMEDAVRVLTCFYLAVKQNSWKDLREPSGSSRTSVRIPDTETGRLVLARIRETTV